MPVKPAHPPPEAAAQEAAQTFPPSFAADKAFVPAKATNGVASEHIQIMKLKLPQKLMSNVRQDYSKATAGKGFTLTVDKNGASWAGLQKHHKKVCSKMEKHGLEPMQLPGNVTIKQYRGLGHEKGHADHGQQDVRVVFRISASAEDPDGGTIEFKLKGRGRKKKLTFPVPSGYAYVMDRYISCSGPDKPYSHRTGDGFTGFSIVMDFKVAANAPPAPEAVKPDANLLAPAPGALAAPPVPPGVQRAAAARLAVPPSSESKTTPQELALLAEAQACSKQSHQALCGFVRSNVKPYEKSVYKALKPRPEPVKEEKASVISAVYAA